MASPEEKFKGLIVVLQGFRIRQQIMFSGLTLLAYDTLLTFDLEYKYIWKAKWSLSKFIYLLLRYFVLAWQLVLFSGYFLGVDTDLMPTYCRIISRTDMIQAVLMHQLAIFTVTLRTSVLYQNQRSINLMLGAGYLLNFFGMLGLVLMFATCQKYQRDWVPVVAFEIFLCFMTVRRAIQQGQIFSTRLTTVLYRDGFAYFAIVFICGALQFFFISVFYHNHYLTLIFWGLVQSNFRAIISITCCRMILNLRGVLTKPSQFDVSVYPTSERPNTSTIRFDRGPKTTADETDAVSTHYQTASERNTVAQSSADEVELDRLS